MQFLYPGFLIALSALAIPVVIHLFNFRRFKTVYFSNVRFLKNVQEETATKNKLKHLLILIARCLALAFLVFAFAQPFIPAKNVGAEASHRAVSIYIDNSFSMEAEVDDEQIIDIAKRKAEEIVNGFTVDDRFQLITNDLEAKHQRLVSKDEMIQFIAAVQPSSVVRSLQEISDRQRDALHREAEDARKLTYMLSDFQENAGVMDNDTSIQVNLVPLVQRAQKNVSVDSMWFTTPVPVLNQAVQICVRLRNYGEGDMENVPVTLRLNEQIKAIADVSIPAKGTTIDTLSFTLTTGGWYSGEISIKDYPVTFDDILYFSFKPIEQIPVLSINGSGENIFLQRFFGNNDLFALKNNPATQIAFSELPTYDLIILNEVNSISGGLADALQQHLTRGGNVMIWPSMAMDVNSFRTFLLANNAAAYGNVIKKQRLVSEVDTKNPVFADVFEKIPRNLTMPSAMQSYELQTVTATREEMLLRFTDRQAMLARYPSGSGFIYLSATPLHRDITDLPVQAGLFAPIMYKVAISNTRTLPAYANIGQMGWINLPGIQLPGDATIKVQSKGDEFIPEIRRTGNNVAVNLSSYVQRSGFYTIVPDAAVPQTDQLLALNYDRLESNMTFADAALLKERYPASNVSVLSNIDRDFTGMVSQMATGTPLWKYCVIFVLVFLAAEIALIRLLP
jgi:hypothetical protein